MPTLHRENSSAHLILFKSNLSASGGLEKYTLRLAKSFLDSDFEVTILTTSSKKKSFPKIDSRINVQSLFQEGPLSVQNLKRFELACKEYVSAHPDCITFGLDRNQSQKFYRAGNGVHAAYLEGRRKVEGFFKRMSFAINPLHKSILKAEKIAYEDPSLKCLFTNSHMVSKQIQSLFEIDQNKLKVVHNGVEWHEYEEYFSSWESQKNLHLKHLGLNHCFTFLFIGHGYTRKGLKFLLQGLHLIKNESFQLLVVGKDKEQKAFQQLAKDLGLENKVRFFGPQKESISFYQMADCLVIPSLYDPFANVTLEALAMGLKVISSASNGASEILDNDSGIILNDLLDPQEMKNALLKLMEKPKSYEQSGSIRNSVRHLDFSNQLHKIVQTTCRMKDITTTKS